jgi:uncharacterized membrane protein YkvA (DUF1232 family)
MTTLAKLRTWARDLKRDVLALWLAARDPRVSVLAKLAAGAVAAYALSPIDLIPDFIPILGYLDDLILVPLGIMAVIRMIPSPVIADLRQRALAVASRPTSRLAAAIIIVIWGILLLALMIAALRRWPF